MVSVTLLCGVLLHDSYLSRADGMMLLFAAILCLALILRMARQAQREGGDSLTREQLAELPQDDSNQMAAVLWLILGMIILPMAARMVVDNADRHCALLRCQRIDHRADHISDRHQPA
nr:hypothetical protein [Pectobacterium parmentieri]